MGKYKVKADYTILRKPVQKTLKGDIYERDITSITPLDDLFTQGQDVVFSDSNFKFSVRTDKNVSRKHSKNGWVKNDNGDIVWTEENTGPVYESDETSIKLKPDYSSLSDFAHYGSALELVRSTLNHVAQYFPGELYFTDKTFGEIISMAEAPFKDYYYISNEFDINVDVDIVEDEDIVNPYRYLCLHAINYRLVEDGNVIENSYIVKDNFEPSKKFCGNGLVGTTVLHSKYESSNSSKERDVTVYVYKLDGITYYLFNDNSWCGKSIRPCDNIVEDYYKSIDVFETILVNRDTKPKYKAIFETPYETDFGYRYSLETYIWPSINDWNPIMKSGEYSTYVNRLISLASFHDEYDADILWRVKTHEAIKNLDWTFLRDDGDTVEDLSEIDSSRIEAMLHLYGRQFDDLKQYIETIKRINKISYDEKGNTPDYLLTDFVENGGFEAYLPNPRAKSTIKTADPLYYNRSIGYSEVDANNAFMRRLKLNERYINSLKGTRDGIKTILGLLGLKDEEFEINEYVCVASATGEYCSFDDSIVGSIDYERPAGGTYPALKDVMGLNLSKDNLPQSAFDESDPDYLNGIAIKGKTSTMLQDLVTLSGETYDVPCYFAIPWYANGKQYDGGWYFQSKGGWAKTNKKLINNTDLTNATAIEYGRIYDESVSPMKYAYNLQEMLSFRDFEVSEGDVCYVTDISDLTTLYQNPEDLMVDVDESGQTNYSHYFILKDINKSSFVGYFNNGEVEGYGWKYISNASILNPTEEDEDAIKVIYLESINENTKGNNPHIGKGIYDDGQEYLDYMGQIFKYALDNDKYTTLAEEDIEAARDYKFDIVSGITDNRKCDYFYCPLIKNPIDISSANTIEQVALELGILKETNLVNNSYDDGYGNKYLEKIVNGQTYAFNYEGGEQDEEPAANSIINVKNVEINFSTLPYMDVEIDDNVQQEELNKFSYDWQYYVLTVVMEYVKQMLPSTTIFKWNFKHFDWEYFTLDRDRLNGIRILAPDNI